MRGGALSRRLARIHLYLRGRTKVCWQHGRHVSELFHSPLCAFIVWQGRPLFYSRRFQRRWEPPTCNLSCEAIFEGKKRHESGHSGHYGDAREFTSIHARFEKLHSPFLLFFFPTRNGSGMIFFSDFSLDLRGNAFFSGRKTLLRCTVSFRVYFYYESVGKQLISQLFEKEFRWSFSVDTINGYLTHRDDFAIFF